MEANLLAEPVRLVAGAKASDHARPSGSETGNGETPIFYSERGLRRTAARALARVLALIASLWLLALILSALGVAPLGELPLPFGLRHSSRQADNHAADRVSAHGELGLPLSLGAAGGSIGGG